MNGNEGVEVMADAYKHTIVGDIIDSIKPENQKQWLESFTFEDIYFRRVPGAPSLEELSNDNLIIDTTMRGYLMTLAYSRVWDFSPFPNLV